jgi:predicted flap endonuclease-1-like 5' DNA nuclease
VIPGARFGQRHHSLSVPGRVALHGAAALLLAVLVLTGPDARASHYRLGSSGLLTGAELEALAPQDVHTTLELFRRTAALADRRTLARKSGLSFARLTELATQCDLLRIEGVGPSVVRLLQAAGVRHAADLRRARPKALYAVLVATNNTHRVMEVVPDERNLSGWIAQAKGLPKVLEGVR